MDPLRDYRRWWLTLVLAILELGVLQSRSLLDTAKASEFPYPLTAALDSEVFEEFPSEPPPGSGASPLISDPAVLPAAHVSPLLRNGFHAHAVGVGYDNGFVIAAAGPQNLRASDSPYLLRLNGWGQLRHTVLDSQGPNADLNQFQLKRARLVFSGHAYTPDFAYYVQLDGRSSSGNDVRLLDYYLTYDLGHHLWNRQQGALVFKTGQYKMPFTMARALSGREFEFTDRSVASTFFDVNRSLAWGLAGRQDQAAVPWKWEVAIFNGLVTGGAETGSSGELDDHFAYSGRLVAFPIGEWGAGALADFDQHEQLAMRTGLAFANTKIDSSGATEFSSLRVVDSGATLASLLPGSVTQYTVSLYTHSNLK